MSNTMMLYLLTRLDAVIVFIVALIVVFGVSALMLGIILGMNATDPFLTKKEEEGLPTIKKWLIRSIFLTALTAIFLVFIPSSKEVAFIYLGGKIADYGENSEELKKLPDNAIKILNKKMEEYILNDKEKK